MDNLGESLENLIGKLAFYEPIPAVFLYWRGMQAISKQKNDKKIAPIHRGSLGDLGNLSTFIRHSIPCQYHQLLFSHTKIEL